MGAEALAVLLQGIPPAGGVRKRAPHTQLRTTTLRMSSRPDTAYTEASYASRASSGTATTTTTQQQAEQMQMQHFVSMRDPDFAPPTCHRRVNGQFTTMATRESVRAGTARLFCDR